MMKKYSVMLAFIGICSVFSISAQTNVGIGTSNPDPSSILHLESTSQGLLMPQMTIAQRDAIVSPAVGLQVFILDDQCLHVYDGSNWIVTCGLKVSGEVALLDDPTNETWVQKATFGGTGVKRAVSFSIGDKGYVGTGNSPVTKAFWEYDPKTNVWTQKTDFLGTARDGAVGFSIGNKGYIGTGSLTKDFYEYDPATDTWVQKADFGGSARNGAVGFSIGNKGYIGTGYDGSTRLNDFWEYDPTDLSNGTDVNGNPMGKWTQKANAGTTIRAAGVGFSAGGKGYVGTGYSGSYLKDFWEYDPSSDTWTQKASLTGSVRITAVGFGIDGKGYIGTGYSGSGNLKDFWEYDPTNNTWTQKPNYGGQALEYATGFSLGHTGYIGIGAPTTQDIWQYTPVQYGPVYSRQGVAGAVVVDDGLWTSTDGYMYNSDGGGVAVGTANPKSSAILDVESTTKGFLPPRMTEAERNGIAAPLEPGLTVWCTDCGDNGEMQVYNGNAWTNMIGGVATPHTPLIGESYGGGKVAYVLQSGDPGYDANIPHGIIAAPTNLSSAYTWGCNGTDINADGTALGTGAANTALIVASCGTGSAGYQCNIYSVTIDGILYDDWYLPSQDELTKVYENRVVLGISGSGRYYTSTEHNVNFAWYIDWSNGNLENGGAIGVSKTANSLSRPIRSF